MRRTCWCRRRSQKCKAAAGFCGTFRGSEARQQVRSLVIDPSTLGRDHEAETRSQVACRAVVSEESTSKYELPWPGSLVAMATWKAERLGNVGTKGPRTQKRKSQPPFRTGAGHLTVGASVSFSVHPGSLHFQAQNSAKVSSGPDSGRGRKCEVRKGAEP